MVVVPDADERGPAPNREDIAVRATRPAEQACGRRVEGGGVGAAARLCERGLGVLNRPAQKLDLLGPGEAPVFAAEPSTQDDVIEFSLSISGG